MTTTEISLALRRPWRHRTALVTLTIAVIVLGLTLAVRSSGGDRDDPVHTSLVEGAGLTAEAATCILEGAADRGVDVDGLRAVILDPGADATISQADQRTVNEVASSCLDG